MILIWSSTYFKKSQWKFSNLLISILHTSIIYFTQSYISNLLKSILHIHFSILFLFFFLFSLFHFFSFFHSFFSIYFSIFRPPGFYVKTGQIISTRVDIFPVEYTSKLASTLDDLDPLPASVIKGKRRRMICLIT